MLDLKAAWFDTDELRDAGFDTRSVDGFGIEGLAVRADHGAHAPGSAAELLHLLLR